MRLPEQTSLSRRILLGGGAGLGLAAACGLVAHNQLRHPHRDKTQHPDGRYRRLTLACPHPANDAVLVVARREGVFARYNLDVVMDEALDSGQGALDRVASGAAQAGLVSALTWLPRLLGGLDARLVVGLQSGSARLLVPRGSAIKRIEDLRRKAIGIAERPGRTMPGADQLFFSIMMRRKGMNPNGDVRWVTLPPDGFAQALEDRRVQAVAGHDPVIWRLRESLHLTELASSTTGSYGTRVSRVLGLRRDVLQADPNAAVVLAMAFREAATLVAGQVRAAASLLGDQLQDMDPAALHHMLLAEGHRVQAVGRDLREQVAQYVDELKLLALVPDAADSAALARRFCDGVVRS